MASVGSWLKKNVLLILLIVALALGIGLGAFLRSVDLSSRQKIYLKFPGDILMRMLKCMIIPLIVSSLISGLAGLDAQASGKMGMRAVVYYFTTTILAAVQGIILVVTMRPGDRPNSIKTGKGKAKPGNIVDSFLDLIRNMLPGNIIEACMRQTKTVQILIEKEVKEMNETMTTMLTTLSSNDSMTAASPDLPTYTPDTNEYDPKTGMEWGSNVLGLVVFSVAVGIAVSKLGELGKPIFHVARSLAEVSMLLVTAIIWYSPIGITFLVASEVIKMEDPAEELRSLGMYIATVITGLTIHGLIVLPLLYFLITRKNVFVFLKNMIHAMLTAFGTASSSATLPVTYRCLEEGNKIDTRVTRFVLPVGATINMDGTALYEAVAAIYISQVYGRELDAGQIITTSITATLASVGAASVPQAGLVTMVIVLSAIGLPPETSAKIMAIDWLLDRFRTAINVLGDAIGAGIVAHLSRHELAASAAGDDTAFGGGDGGSDNDGYPHVNGLQRVARVKSDIGDIGDIDYPPSSVYTDRSNQQITDFTKM